MRKINLKAVAWVVIVVIVVVAVAAAIIGRQGNGPGGGSAAPVGTPVYAPQGEVVQGFPKELILDNAAVVANSYSINYSATANQYTAQWSSSSSIGSLYSAYKQYLPTHGWTITNDISKYKGFYGLYATNASSASVNVSLNQKGSGSAVVVTYLAQ